MKDESEGARYEKANKAKLTFDGETNAGLPAALSLESASQTTGQTDAVL